MLACPRSKVALNDIDRALRGQHVRNRIFQESVIARDEKRRQRLDAATDWELKRYFEII